MGGGAECLFGEYVDDCCGGDDEGDEGGEEDKPCACPEWCGVCFRHGVRPFLVFVLCCVSGSMVRFFCIDLRERFVHAREERFSC